MIKINSNSDNCLVAIDNNGKEYEITYEMLGKYSEYANEDDVEGYFFHVIDDKYVAGAVLWASGQGGMIVVWDCEMGKLVHVSEGAYAVTVAIHHDMVYFLADVSHWGDAPKQLLCAVPFGVMDAEAEGKSVELAGLMDSPQDFLDDENCRIEFAGDKVIVRNLSNNKKVEVTL